LKPPKCFLVSQIKDGSGVSPGLGISIQFFDSKSLVNYLEFDSKDTSTTHQVTQYNLDDTDVILLS